MGNGIALCLLLLLASISSAWSAGSGHNTTHVLAKFPNFSSMSKLLVETGVVREIDTRSSLTVLLISNSVLDAFVSSVGAANLLLIADVLRYHCILQYLDIPEIRSMTNATGTTLPTLYQTTGRATGTMGFIKVAVNPKTKAIRIGLPEAAVFNASVVTNVTQFPYNVSYMQVDHVVTPAGLENSAAASPSVSSGIAQLKRLGNFGVILGLLDSTGVAKALKSMSAVTVLAPTDAAFKGVSIDGLSQAEKIKLVQFHCIPTYFTFGSLQAISTPLPTVATSSSAKFSLNVTSAGKDAVSFATGVNTGSVSETIVDDPPVAIYSVDKVLLPPEIFAVAPTPAPGPFSPSPSPALSPSPELAPTPAPELSPSPSPELSPSPTPELAPSPSPLAASPPAPPLSPSAAESPSEEASAPKGGALSGHVSSLIFTILSAAAAAAAL